MVNELFLFTPVAAFALDCLLGELPNRFHPVVGMGTIISRFELIFYYAKDSKYVKFLKGGFVVLLTLATITMVTLLLLWLASLVNSTCYYSINCLLLYFTIAPKSLATTGQEIMTALQLHNIEFAREKVRMIVGRETQQLDESEITRATIETIAENIVDGVISPLFYFFVGGTILAVLYRCVNTMDSMMGYKNKKYIYFGRIAARLDDLMNYVPARLTFLLLVLSAMILRFDFKKAWRIGLRDAAKHPSPNGGYAEAPVAGALHIRLGGENYYEGIPEFRAYMGDADELLPPRHIQDTIRLMYGSIVIGLTGSVLFVFLWEIV